MSIDDALSFEQDYSRRFHGVEIQHGNSLACTYTPYDNKAQIQQIAEHVGSLRAQLFAEIENDTRWIDINAIDAFFESIGLQRKDFLIVRSSELPVYNRIMNQYGWPTFPDPTEEYGYYYGVCPAATELGVVLRDNEAEAIHGTVFTEGHLVHELAHATSDWNEWSIETHAQGRTLSARRLGQIIFDRRTHGKTMLKGGYLEEAFASSIEAGYLKSQGKELGYKNYADIAAEGLAYLRLKSPDLFPAMIKARQSVDGLRQVAKYINAIHPGLYTYLQNIANTEKGFIQASKHIQELLS